MDDEDTGAPAGGANPTTGDMLRDIFARQAELGQFYRQMRPEGFYGLPPLEKCTTWTRAIIHECCELDDELGWKPWKNAPDREANRAARLEETADILHFVVELALCQGFSADELYAAYVRKNAANRERQRIDPRYRAVSAAETETDA
ncbi:MAG TPA: dUTPase [Ktedonobacterales bacterium]|nr:dUTPase [Ktedonobacterales bacterium]